MKNLPGGMALAPSIATNLSGVTASEPALPVPTYMFIFPSPREATQMVTDVGKSNWEQGLNLCPGM